MTVLKPKSVMVVSLAFEVPKAVLCSEEIACDIEITNLHTLLLST